MANPADTTYSIIREVTEGVTPATPAMLYLDYIPNSDNFGLDSKSITSDVLKQNRALSGMRKVSYTPTGSIKTQGRRDTAYEKLMESAFSGVYSANVLKAGNTDTFHTIEKKMLEGATAMYWRYAGMQARKYNLTVSPDANVEETFEMIGMARTSSNAVIPSASYNAPVQGAELDGTDVGTITIAGLNSVRYMSLDLSVEHNREAKFALGSPNAFGTGTSGIRTVKLVVEMYRQDLGPETLFLGDTPVAVSFSIGTGANGRTFTLPAAVGSIPMDSTSGSNALVKVEFTATNDATAGTDIMVSKP